MARRRVTPISLGPALRKVLTKDGPEYASKVHQKVHIQASNDLIFDTPVGNPDLWKSPPPPGYVGGRARGNWQSTTGAPAGSETGNHDPSGASTVAASISVARRIKPGDVSYVTNNVPYIQRLNDGWSKQQPAAFVERAQDRARKVFG